MNKPTAQGAGDTLIALSLDVWSAKALVWVATLGRDARLTPEAQLYFYDRYRRLAEYHRSRGRLARAARLQAKADAHYIPPGGPPYAAAMALPRPRRLVVTDAVSRHRFEPPDDAA